MYNKKITNIGIIGIGTIGKRHLMAIDQIDDINLVGIVDLSEPAQKFCLEKNIPLFKNLNELLKNNRVDGVIISTPTISHYENAISAMELGLDILIEKPIAATVIEAQEITKTAIKNKCKVLVGHQRRFYPLVLKTKEIVKNNELGEVVGLSGLWALRKDKDYFIPEWRKEITAGPVITNLIHDIDYLRFIFGDIEEVTAFTSNIVNDFDKEDVVTANLKFKNGILGNFLITDCGTSPWSWETATGENIHLPNLIENNLRVIGTKGSLEFPNLKIWKYKNNGENWMHEIYSKELAFSNIDPYVSQINHFKDIINRIVEPVTSSEDAELTLKVALSILDSAVNKKSIKI
jgi:predicted dehydrogenase